MPAPHITVNKDVGKEQPSDAKDVKTGCSSMARLTIPAVAAGYGAVGGGIAGGPFAGATAAAGALINGVIAIKAQDKLCEEKKITHYDENDKIVGFSLEEPARVTAGSRGHKPK